MKTSGARMKKYEDDMGEEEDEKGEGLKDD